MPNCFQLFPKSNPKEAAILNKVDEEICKHFEVPVDPVKYVCGWCDSIGFRVACGKSFADIRKEFTERASEEPKDKPNVYNSLLQILNFLDERYTTDCWVEVGKH